VWNSPPPLNASPVALEQEVMLAVDQEITVAVEEEEED
jgi:hypothetical protein